MTLPENTGQIMINSCLIFNLNLSTSETNSSFSNSRLNIAVRDVIISVLEVQNLYHTELNIAIAGVANATKFFFTGNYM